MIHYRLADISEAAMLQELIDLSARGLREGFYSAEQVEAGYLENDAMDVPLDHGGVLSVVGMSKSLIDHLP